MPRSAWVCAQATAAVRHLRITGITRMRPSAHRQNRTSGLHLSAHRPAGLARRAAGSWPAGLPFIRRIRRRLRAVSVAAG